MDKNLLYIGAGLVGVFLLTQKKSTPSTKTFTSSPGVQNTGSGTSYTTPVNNSSQTPGYYVDATGNKVTVQPTPAQNAGLTDPGYQMTPSELATYNANYLDLQQGMRDWIPKYGSLNAALQAHWNQAGCAEHRTFLPLVSKYHDAYIPPPPNDSGWLSTALSVVTTVAPFIAGVNDNAGIDQLTYGDKQLLLTGSAVVNELLPLYGDSGKARGTAEKMNSILSSIV